jgi:hypothetical protein
MTRNRPITFRASAAVRPVAALAVAACSGDGAATAGGAEDLDWRDGGSRCGDQ